MAINHALFAGWLCGLLSPEDVYRRYYHDKPLPTMEPYPRIADRVRRSCQD